MYLDDGIVITDTFERHRERLNLVTDHLQRAGLKLNPAKCKLFQLKTKFLGHVISGRGDPEKVRAVLDGPTPRNTEAKGFVALASCYRRFVGSFAEIARPIHLLTQKNRPFAWEDTQQETFERLKHCLVTAPVLSLPCDEGVTCLPATPVMKR